MQALLAAAWPERLDAHPRTACLTTSALLQDAMPHSQHSQSSNAGVLSHAMLGRMEEL